MAEQINRGDSYYRIINVTAKDEDGDKEPYDLTDYTDNYVAIKTGRGIPDNEAYIFKRVPFKGEPSEGKLILNLTPYETDLLPSTADDEVETLYAYIQIGSTITGRIHEVSVLRLKTKEGGVLRKSKIYKGYDMGPLSETIGWIRDAGTLCQEVSIRIDFGQIPMPLFLDGGSLSDMEVSIYDMGLLSGRVNEITDLGQMRDCKSSS